jgi:hypothetical protein
LRRNDSSAALNALIHLDDDDDDDDDKCEVSRGGSKQTREELIHDGHACDHASEGAHVDAVVGDASSQRHADGQTDSVRKSTEFREGVHVDAVVGVGDPLQRQVDGWTDTVVGDASSQRQVDGQTDSVRKSTEFRMPTLPRRRAKSVCIEVMSRREETAAGAGGGRSEGVRQTDGGVRESDTATCAEKMDLAGSESVKGQFVSMQHGSAKMQRRGSVSGSIGQMHAVTLEDQSVGAHAVNMQRRASVNGGISCYSSLTMAGSPGRSLRVGAASVSSSPVDAQGRLRPKSAVMM